MANKWAVPSVWRFTTGKRKGLGWPTRRRRNPPNKSPAPIGRHSQIEALQFGLWEDPPCFASGAGAGDGPADGSARRSTAAGTGCAMPREFDRFCSGADLTKPEAQETPRLWLLGNRG